MKLSVSHFKKVISIVCIVSILLTSTNLSFAAADSTKRYLIQMLYNNVVFQNGEDQINMLQSDAAVSMQIQKAKNAGYNTVSINAPWRQLQPYNNGNDSDFDWSRLDTWLDDALINKGMNVIIGINATCFNMPAWIDISDTSPYLARVSNGDVAACRGIDGRRDREWALNNSTLVNWIKRYTEKLVEHVYNRYSSNQDAYGRILAYQPCIGQTEESDMVSVYQGDFNSAHLVDYSDSAKAAFRSWCQTKYGTIAAVNAKWGTSYGNFNDVVMGISPYKKYVDWMKFRQDTLYNFYKTLKDAAVLKDVNFKMAFRESSALIGFDSPMTGVIDRAAFTDVIDWWFVDNYYMHDKKAQAQMRHLNSIARMYGNRLWGNETDPLEAAWFWSIPFKQSFGDHFLNQTLKYYKNLNANSLDIAHFNDFSADTWITRNWNDVDVWNWQSSAKNLLSTSVPNTTKTKAIYASPYQAVYSNQNEVNGGIEWDKAGEKMVQLGNDCEIITDDVFKSPSKLLSFTGGIYIPYARVMTQAAKDGIKYAFQNGIPIYIDNCYTSGVLDEYGEPQTSLYDYVGDAQNKPQYYTLFHASSGYSGTQGVNGWYYMESTGTGYNNMTYDTTNSYWKGSYNNCIVGSNWQHPDTYDSARKWVAPADGYISIKGNVSRPSTNGDGVNVKIVKNSADIWTWQTINPGASKSHEIWTSVTKGDSIYFIVNKNSTFDYDTTYWDPVINYEQTPNPPVVAPVTENAVGGNGKALIRFSPLPTSNLSYKIKYGTQSGNYTNTITGVTSSPYVVTGINNDTTYYFTVVSTNGTTESTISNELAVTPRKYFSDYNVSAESYSEVMGYRDWYYYTTNDAVSYQQMNWQKSTEINWKSADLGTWYGASNNSNYIKNDYWASMSPSNSIMTAKAWKAPATGTVKIYCNLRKISSGGNGVNFKVMKNGTQIWPQSGWLYLSQNDLGKYTMDVSATVSANDYIYFLVDSNSDAQNDAISCNPTIYYTSTETASTGFSGNTGTNNWYYREWNGTNYINMTYNSASTSWKGSDINTQLGNNWQQCSTTDAVRDWAAATRGTVRITGTVKKAVTGGDGVNVKVLKNDIQIWPSSGWQFIGPSDTTGYNVDAVVNVLPGDIIRFVSNKYSTTASDKLTWDPQVKYLETYTASEGFSNNNGRNNWKYQYYNGTSFTDMTWDSANLNWKGTETFCIIKSNIQHPQSNSTARSFITAKAGTVRIRGNVAKSDVSGGDGVRVKITKNGTKIWPANTAWQTINYNDSTGYDIDISQTVNANDSISFIVDNGGSGNYSNDTTKWDAIVSYY